MDERIIKHAEILCEWSTEIKENDNVVIDASPEAKKLVEALYREIGKRNANPITLYSNEEADRNYLNHHKPEFDTPEHVKALFKESDVLINIKSPKNLRSLNNVSDKKLMMRSKSMKPISDLVEDKRWVLTQHPTNSQAQLAELSYTEYEDFVYDSILVDWEEIQKKQQKLVNKLKKGSKVEITGPRTNLELDIEGSEPQNSCGKKNMPSGEVFTAPKPDSASGQIYFDLPIIYQGKEIHEVELRFEKGEVIDFSAEKGEEYLKELIEIDNGSNRLGELGIGTNRGIDKFTKNILFDEKLGDTLHLALGRAIKESVGKNKRNESAVHIDMIKNMEEGELRVDGEEILKEGSFFWEKP